VTRLLVLLAASAALIPALAGCGGGGDEDAEAKPAAPRCPAAWRPGWQRLADRVGAPVYCPSWMPSPLDGDMDGEWENGVSVGRDRSYLVSFVWHEHGNDVHVNFRGYPGRTAIPRCEDVRTVAGKTRRRAVPCFSDRQATRRLGGIAATVYRVNRDADQWHVLYAWRHGGSLYTLSEHVAPPYGYTKTIRNLERMLRGLVLVRPKPQTT
jgi:hypothetical protein